MNAPPITHNPRRPLSAKDWEEQQATIERLYATENKKLQEVIEIMEKEYRFRATYVHPPMPNPSQRSS